MKKLSIQELLYMTMDEYWDYYVGIYMRWCMQYALKVDDNTIDENDLQKLLSNTAINKWFTDRHEDLENQAYAVLRPQHCTITKDTAHGIYNAVLVDIFKSYPKPLFDAARKLTLIGNLN